MQKYLDSGVVPKEISEFEESTPMDVQAEKKIENAAPVSEDSEMKRVHTAIVNAVTACYQNGKIAADLVDQSLDTIVQVKQTSEKQKKHGDLFCNIALIISGRYRQKNKQKGEKSAPVPSPYDIAKQIMEHLSSDIPATVTENGFINFVLPKPHPPTVEMKDKRKKDKGSTVTTPAHKLEV